MNTSKSVSPYAITMRRAVATMLLVALGSFPSTAVARRAAVPEDGACTQTTEAMLNACGGETRDDFWLAMANCANQTTGRRACRRDAREGREEAGADCVDQQDARAGVCEELGEAAYDPQIDPDDFVSPAEAAANPNPFMPLIPGSEWIYQGGGETVTVTVTGETKEILGVTCVVVRDVVTNGGIPVEDTIDWFAQDQDGNVWYMGEISQGFEDGELNSLDGSWKAGVDGAKPGIAMPADPDVGDVYRQEFFLGDAEDIAEILSLAGDESSPVAACGGACLVTAETTPIEPDALEHKYYAAGVGFILEVDGETGERGIELVSVNIP